jgi:glyoxylase-like metal-dependent hydrolase (beta-lactamase superfamily II)
VQRRLEVEDIRQIVMTDIHLTRITEHLYWLPPGPPDRPSLGVVLGGGRTLLLDAGASAAHTRLLLSEITAAGLPIPCYVALTHWHWDHVFGAAELGAPVIAHQDTAEQLARLAQYDWNDAALDARVANGDEIAFCADNIKLELPEPRTVRIARPEIIFEETLTLRLGDVTCQLQHAGGDHAPDSCVAYVTPDRVLFLGDCLYDAIYARVRHYTTCNLFPLLDKLLGFEAQFYIEGHNNTVMTRAELEVMTGKMRLAGRLVDQYGADRDAVLRAIQTQTGQPVDEDTQDFVNAFIAGHQLEHLTGG